MIVLKKNNTMPERCEAYRKVVPFDRIKTLTADTLVFVAPIYYYEMSGQMKTLLDRLNPLYPSDYKFRNVYMMSVAAENDIHVPDRAVNRHEAGVRYAERLAAYGYAAYVFDFCGGSAGGTQNRSDGSNSEMSVLTEASDLSAVLDAAKAWPFVDSDKIFLLGGSQGGLVTIITGCERQDELAGMMLMYPALSAKADSQANSYASPEDVPLFGGWMHVGRNYITDLWQVDLTSCLRPAVESCSSSMETGTAQSMSPGPRKPLKSYRTANSTSFPAVDMSSTARPLRTRWGISFRISMDSSTMRINENRNERHCWRCNPWRLFRWNSSPRH